MTSLFELRNIDRVTNTQTHDIKILCYKLKLYLGPAL